MTKTKFLFRMIFLVVVITTFLIATMLLLLLPRTQIGDVKYMPLVYLLIGLPVTASYILICYFAMARPLALFLADAAKGQVPDNDVLAGLQDTCLKLPYFMAGMAFIAYVSGVPFGAWFLSTKMEMSRNIMPLAVLSAGICGLTSIILYMYGGHWLVEPVLARIAESAPGLTPSRAAGLRIPVRLKLVGTMVALVISAAGYIFIISYDQIDGAVENMELMEEHLPEDVKARLAGEGGGDQALGFDSAKRFRADMKKVVLLYSILLVVTAVMALVLGTAASNHVTKPIRLLRKIAWKARKGDYGEPVRLITNDELSELGYSINTMMGTMVGQVGEMKQLMDILGDGILRIDESSNTILAVSAQQSSGATEQAASVQETSSIAEEIVATARQISERSKTLEEVASQSLEACNDGEARLSSALAEFEGIKARVDDIREALAQLETRFHETYKIVEWMEDVADETELLSLNASLEAAGAGEAGRRFSVVAEATRRLAARAGAATVEIRALVKTIQEATEQATSIAESGREKVAVGAEAIDATAEGLRSISDFTRSTSSAVQEISVSTGQQTSASEQLASSMAEVSEVAKKVEQGAKEIEAAVTELREFSEPLRELVERRGDS